MRNRSGMVSSLRKKQFKLSESSVLWYLGGCCRKSMLLRFHDILKGFLGTQGPCSRCPGFTLALDYVPAFLHFSDGKYCSSPMLQWSGLPLVCCAPGICLCRILSLPATIWLFSGVCNCFRAILLQRSPSNPVLVSLSLKFHLQTAVSLSSFKPEIIAQVQASPLSPCVFLLLVLSFFVITSH